MYFWGLLIDHVKMNTVVKCYRNLNPAEFVFPSWACYISEDERQIHVPSLYLKQTHYSNQGSWCNNAVSLYRKLIKELICKPNEVIFFFVLDGQNFKPLNLCQTLHWGILLDRLCYSDQTLVQYFTISSLKVLASTWIK